MATDYREEARRAAQRYGLDPYIFQRQIGQESGFNPTIRSPKGATGIAQIMPETAKGWGVDPLDPIASLNAAAKNMAGYVKKYGGYENALRAYNAGPGAIERSKGYAETNHYVSTILGGRTPNGLGTPTGSAPAAAGKTRSAAAPTSSAPAAQPLIGGGGQAGDFTTLLGTLLGQPEQQAPTSSPIAPPSFSSALKMPTGALPLAPTPQAAPAQDRVGAALSLVQALGAQDPTQRSSEAPAAADGAESVPIAQKVMQQRAGGGGVVPLGGSKNAGKGSFAIDGPSPDRLTKQLVSFADKVAAVAGVTLVGKDGSTHDKYTVNGNVSQHYSGQATDIFSIGGKPAVGDRLIRAGQAALIAAGMPRAEALKQQGGLYNVGSHQIIFHTSGVANGGNHMDHLHISAR